MKAANKRALRIALVGNPNSGKSSLFNLLTGLHQKVSNYPGITVERRTGLVRWGKTALAELIDLPGTYSLHPTSEDERVVYQALVSPTPEEVPDVIVGVVDGTNIKRHLYLFTQVLDLGMPAVLAITMTDEMERRGQDVDKSVLEKALGIEIIFVNGRSGEGVESLKEAVLRAKPSTTMGTFFNPQKKGSPWMKAAQEESELITPYGAWLWATEPSAEGSIWVELRDFSANRLRVDETVQRYSELHRVVKKGIKIHPEKDRRLSAKIDRVLTHPFYGGVVLLTVLFILFQAVFFWAEGAMNTIDFFFSRITSFVESQWHPGLFTDLVANGIVPGVAGVLMFLPQIALLFLFISLLEESGYMARVVFMMDKILRPFGLSGKSVVPMVSGTACAIPAIMATRTIENPRERLLTLLVTPFMTCSARLPVYTILIALVIPKTTFGPFDARGFVLLALYLLGFLGALGAAAIAHRFLPQSKNVPFLLEMPRYRMPHIRNVWITVWGKSKSFVTEAGKIIVAISILLWGLASFGPLPLEEMKALPPAERLENSFIGHVGQAMEPAIAPLGYDWKIGIAILSSFAAREVFVGTMATIYAVGSDDIGTVREHMARERNPDTGEPFFTLPVGISLMLFYAFAMQCLSTFAVVKKETNSWFWPIFQTVAMTSFAYIVSWIAFQILS